MEKAELRATTGSHKQGEQGRSRPLCGHVFVLCVCARVTAEAAVTCSFFAPRNCHAAMASVESCFAALAALASCAAAALRFAAV